MFQIPFLLLAYWNVGTVVRMKRRQKHFQQLQRGGGGIMTNKTQQSSPPRALADTPRDQQDEKETNKPKERGAVESGNDTRYKLIF